MCQEVKVQGGRSYIWKPGGDIILGPLTSEKYEGSSTDTIPECGLNYTPARPTPLDGFFPAVADARLQKHGRKGCRSATVVN